MEQKPHISAIICEYNPFHNGHKYHMEETRRQGATHIVAVMSGNFVQRGEPAMLNKWARAAMALQNGADLVLELPTPWAMASAEPFASGGVALANAMGCVDSLSFGSESGNLPSLQAAAQALVLPDTLTLMKTYLREGMSYAQARESAVRQTSGEQAAGLLRKPNNTLAIEYLKALNRSQSRIRPLTVPRTGARHDSHSTQERFASASLLRHRMLEDGLDCLSTWMPESSLAVLHREKARGLAPASLLNGERALLSYLRRLSARQLAAIHGVSEGLENRLYTAIRHSTTLEELFAALKTKRYPLSRLRRMVMAAFLGLQKDTASAEPPYLRVLGFNQAGTEILRQMRTTAQLPILMRAADRAKLSPEGRRVFDFECTATDLYALFCPIPQPCGAELTTNTIRILPISPNSSKRSRL